MAWPICRWGRQYNLNAAASSAATAGFSPLSLSPALWLDAGLSPLFQDSAGTVPATADGDPVGYWGDKSGNANHATQATAAARVTLKLAVQNGLPVLRFDGADDRLGTPDLTVTDFTAVFVVRQTGDNALLGTAAANTPQLRIGNPADKLMYFDGANFPNSTTLDPAQGNWSALAFVRGGSTVAFYQDDQARGSGASGGAQTFNQLGAFFGAVLPLNGDLAAVLFFPVALAAADLTLVFDYLRSRWGTP